MIERGNWNEFRGWGMSKKGWGSMGNELAIRKGVGGAERRGVARVVVLAMRLVK